MTLEELNAFVASGEISELIRVSEAIQVKAISRIADSISSLEGIRIVLVAGASSAGKTTTAKRLCTQLYANQHRAIHISTDDYFVDDLAYPRLPNGELDYESVHCVHIDRLVRDLADLMDGKSVPRRRFDFARHKGEDTAEMLKLPEDGAIVLEGIHALNPQLTSGIDDYAKFGVFVEPRPSLELLPSLRPGVAISRLLRRLVRDNHFRKVDPADTFRMWPHVVESEATWIDPYRRNARVTFDSYLVYELAVLKYYAGGLLVRAREELGDNPDVMRLIHLLEPVMPVSADKVPGNSILRETIGGSQLDY